MLTLNLPVYEFTISHGIPAKIFDFIRKRYVALTPEEWVRQNFLKFLVTEKKYPQSLILVEQTLQVHQMKKRCDAVIYDNSARPLMIIEFKKPEVAISQAVFDQIARYNIPLKVKYLMVSNGLQHFCSYIDFDNNTYHFLEDIPQYTSL
ncbi:MAG: type I restriction enzyme HsdR N-terminal domain-containing protein [Bacteroidota bacterium]